MPKLQPPLKWHGGKHYLATRIVELMPPHIHYVEPYFGGGAVLFAKPTELIEDHSEVVNDINGELMNFWNVLRCPGEYKRLRRYLEATPFSQAVFKTADSPADGFSHVDRAWRFFCRYRQSRQGLGKDFATLSRNRTRRGMNEQASAWLTCIEGLPEIHARLKRVVILHSEATKVIRQQDGPHTFFYCDPPYLHETRSVTKAYEFEMTEQQHADLLAVLASVQGKFILSGYHSGLYYQQAKRCGWNRTDFDLPNNASSARTKKRMTECVWMNY